MYFLQPISMFTVLFSIRVGVHTCKHKLALCFSQLPLCVKFLGDSLKWTDEQGGRKLTQDVNSHLLVSSFGKRKHFSMFSFCRFLAASAPMTFADL